MVKLEMLKNLKANGLWNEASHLLPVVRAHSLPALQGCPAAHSKGLTGTCAICESSTYKKRTEASWKGSKYARQITELWRHGNMTLTTANGNSFDSA